MHTEEELDQIWDLYCDKNSTTLNYTICTEEIFVECRMFPKTIKPMSFLVPITMFLLLVLVTGLLGNLSVCVVIMRHPNMRTETNVYLFSLAVSDILLLVFGLAPELWTYWQTYPYIFGNFACRVTKLLASTATWASALTVVAFSVERYTAICCHTSFRTRSKKRVAIALIAIWTVSVAVSLPMLHLYKFVAMANYPPAGPGVYSLLSTKCIPSAKYKYQGPLYKATCALFFFAPMVILTLMYIKIGVYIRNNRKLARKNGIHNSCSENTKTIGMMVAVVVLFFLCGAPFHFQRLTNTNEYKNADYERTVLIVTGAFYYASAAANPILYNIWCKRYRKAFMEIINIGTTKKKQLIQMDTVKDTNVSKKSTTTTTTTANTYTTQ